MDDTLDRQSEGYLHLVGDGNGSFNCEQLLELE